MPDMTGTTIDRYQILEPLGEGGMATVYKAYDTRLENEVAVKVIRGNMFARKVLERVLMRFEREAHTTAMLAHPNIIGVIDYGEYEGSPYMVMPYIPGGTLKQLIERGVITWGKAVRILIPIAQALDYAHQQGVIHRDVKPSNILLTQAGEPMLSDFGVAKLFEMEETSELTGTGMGVGTPEYMAPEQTGRNVDHRADIYSLGIVLYEMLTGRRPYEADTPLDVLVKQVSEPLPKPSQFRKGIPAEVERILLKALAKKPEDRYQSMGEMAKALEDVADAEKWIKRSRIFRKGMIGLAWVVGFTALVAMGIGGSGLWQADQQFKATATYKAYAWSITQAKIDADEHAKSTATAQVQAVATMQADATATARAQISATAESRATATAIAYATATAQALTRVIDPDTASLLTVLFTFGVNDQNSSPDFTGKIVNAEYGQIFSPDGKWVVSTSMEQSDSGSGKCVKRLNRVADGQLIRSWGLEDAISCAYAVFSENGEILATVIYYYYQHKYEVHLWRTEDGKLLQSMMGQSDWGWWDIAISPDGEILASQNDVVRLWRVADGELLRTMTGSDDIAFLSNGEILATSDRSSLHLWRVEDGKHIATVPHGTISPDGETIASPFDLYNETSVRLYRALDGKLQHTLELSTGRASSIAFSPDGDVVAVGTENGTVWLWRVSDGNLLGRHDGISSRPGSLAFSQNGQILASGSGTEVILWDVENFNSLQTLVTKCSEKNNWWQDYSGQKLIFTPDGKTLISSCSDGLIELWGFR